MATIDTVNIKANGMVFRCRVAGDPANEPVILLHGWPETSHMWVKLMQKLSDQGFYCVAPDQRGFSPDARPPKVKDYMIGLLARDVLALADAFGFKDFHLIGHDWGSAIGWAVVAGSPDRIKSWTALSVPHVKAFGNALRNDRDQRKMSRYMALFQWRGIPEWFLLKKDRQNLRRTWKKSSDEELEEYLAIIGNRPALKATLNYYRANYRTLKKGKDMEAIGQISVPTIFIWGSRDIAIARTGAENTANYMNGPYRFIELDAGHWLMQEAFDECAGYVLTHLNEFR